MTTWPFDLAVRKADDGLAVIFVALILPPHLAKQFPAAVDHEDFADAGLRRMGPHVTVCYLKVEPGDVGVVQSAAAFVAGRTEPFTLELGPVGHFDNDESVAFVHVRGGGVHDLRSDLLAEVFARGVDATQTYPDFVPHATLGYLPAGTRWTGSVPSGSWVVDRLDLHTPDVVESMVLGSGERDRAPDLLAAHWPADLAVG